MFLSYLYIKFTTRHKWQSISPWRSLNWPIKSPLLICWPDIQQPQHSLTIFVALITQWLPSFLFLVAQIWTASDSVLSHHQLKLHTEFPAEDCPHPSGPTCADLRGHSTTLVLCSLQRRVVGLTWSACLQSKYLPAGHRQLSSRHSLMIFFPHHLHHPFYGIF